MMSDVTEAEQVFYDQEFHGALLRLLLREARGVCVSWAEEQLHWPLCGPGEDACHVLPWGSYLEQTSVWCCPWTSTKQPITNLAQFTTALCPPLDKVMRKSPS